jgi:hypothetical protein
LFLAGGVEVLEATVPASAGLQLNPLAKSWAFVRSPADVFFYSGHAGFWNGNLVLDTAGHGYAPWLDPEELLASWDVPDTGPIPVDVLILNGCSVLGNSGPTTNSSNEPAPPCAYRWQKLLKSEGGPLKAILGYRGTAPMDRMDGGQAGGDQIALEMAQAMLDSLKTDWGSYARKWVEINAKYPSTRTAAAMDEKGYYYINKEMEPASHTHRARRLGGYISGRSEDTIFGPGPIPDAVPEE